MRLDVARSGPAESGLALGPPTGLAAAVVGFAPVIALAGAQGGYFPSAWGWATFPLLWLAALALALRDRIRLSRLERAFVGLLFALTLWILLSATWSVASAASVLESQRALLYVAGVAAALLISRSRDISALLGGLLAAICAIALFSLATRVLPDRVGVFDATTVYRLAQPIGYWNGLAIFVAIGTLIAVAFATRANSAPVRAMSAAALVWLLPTFYFTFGRGAWIALGAGLVAAVAVDPRRLQLLAGLFVLLPLPALAVVVASREPALTHAGAVLARAVHDGHRLALVVVILAAANAVLALAFGFVERRFEPSLWTRRSFGAAVVILLLVGVSVVFVRYGSPATLAQKGYRAFKAPPPHAQGNLNKRLLSFSGNGRADLWRLAWDDARAHPLSGAGAGTYERFFLAHQPAGIGRVRDAHGLYIETLAELGPLGLILLLSALLVPLAALGKARTHPLVPGATGAYVAYLVHTGVDWDWELPAITLAALLCGAAILVSARRSVRAPRLVGRTRWAGVALIVVLAGLAAVGLVGNTALSRSEAAREHGDWRRAAVDARRAKTWMAWSPKPWEALGRAELGAGLVPEARASFRKAISMDPGDWQLYYRLALASKGAERRRALRQVDRLFPQAPPLPKGSAP